MKTSILFVTMIVCALSSPIVSAQEKCTHAKSTMGMDKLMPQMQENMTKMQQQMTKIQATTDPKERQKLMQEHMQSMKENMNQMRGMGGSMMTGSGQTCGMELSEQKTIKGGDRTNHHDMMENRMDMMQMMMEQMVQHQNAQEPMQK